jgi:hypothetical protein
MATNFKRKEAKAGGMILMAELSSSSDTQNLYCTS